MVGESDTARARISRRILWNKEKFTFDEWSRAAFDTYVIEAETEIPRLARPLGCRHCRPIRRSAASRQTGPGRDSRIAGLGSHWAEFLGPYDVVLACGFGNRTGTPRLSKTRWAHWKAL